MAQMTPAAELIAGLMSEGWTYADIGRALGVNGSYVRQAIHPSPGAKQKPATKYVPALESLQGKRPGAKPGALPGKRTTKAGTAAKVRTTTKEGTTKKGAHYTVTTVRKAPATLKRAIADAVKGDKRVRWDVHFKHVKVYPDQKLSQCPSGYASGHLPAGWNAQRLLDRIDNPQEGDNWQPGDVNGALVAIAREQNPKILDVSGPDEFNLIVTD